MPYLLDTNIAIHLRDGDPRVRALMLTLDDLPMLSAITRVELEGGVYARPELADRRRQAVDVILGNFAVIDFTDDLAARYGEIVAQAGFSRRKIIDRMIAATALAHGLTLVTMNGDDFRDVPGLKLEVWPSA